MNKYNVRELVSGDFVIERTFLFIFKSYYYRWVSREFRGTFSTEKYAEDEMKSFFARKNIYKVKG